MKTFRELFEELDEPYRSQAVENTQNAGLELDVEMAENVAEAINEGFAWHRTDQGYDYWNELYQQTYANI